MNIRFKNRISKVVIVLAFSITTISCSKDAPGAKVELSYNLIQEKTWFLDYTQTIVGANITTRTYIGQPTYFINFLADRSTVDSDGITGKYTVTSVGGKLGIDIAGKSTNGNAVNYSYQVESIGAKNLVLTYTMSGTNYKMFFSAK